MKEKLGEILLALFALFMGVSVFLFGMLCVLIGLFVNLVARIGEIVIWAAPAIVVVGIILFLVL